MTDFTYRPGDVVAYRDFMGELRRVRVTEREADVKNGRPGFDGVLVEPTASCHSGEQVWGYDSQIVRVEAAS